jgi:alanine racemase
MTGRGWSIDAWRQWCAKHVEHHPGHLFANGPETGMVRRLTADTRTLQHPEDTVFFALKGPWHDGHDFVVEAHRVGVRRFVVSHCNGSEPWAQDADVLVVDDVLLALQRTSRAQRDSFEGPVLAITGSNGKTTVKEWIAQLLPDTTAVHRSPLSHNSQLGVPLSVWSLDTHHDVSLIEAGISHPGEMVRLRECIAPTEGVLTHLGDAHAGNFRDASHLVEEKCALFNSVSRVFMPHSLAEACGATLDGEIITWGDPSEAQVHLGADLTRLPQAITLHWQGEQATASLPFHDLASVRNALTASLVALHHGATLASLVERLPQLHELTGRLSSVARPQGGVLLQDDCSHDLGSLDVALEALNRIPHDLPSLALVGDVPQSGLDPEKRADELARRLAQSQLDAVWMWVPEWSESTTSVFFNAIQQASSKRRNLDVQCFHHNDALEGAARNLGAANVLVKVSSHERLGAVMNALAPRRHVTALTLNASALIDNVRILKAHVGAQGILAVIKGLGYGTDPVVLGRLLEAQGVDWLAVAYADEGMALREAGIEARILVLNPDPGTFEVLATHRLEPQLVSSEHVHLAQQWAAAKGLTAWPVHLKLDTGMRRLGVAENEDARVAELMSGNELELVTVMSHLAGADDPSLDDSTRAQLEQFHRRTSTHYPGVPAHILNSAGAARVHEIVPAERKGEWDPLMKNIRVGLAMYGLGAGSLELGLQPVLSLETGVAKLVHVPAGQGAGYGWTDAANHDRVLAVLSVGYADGYPRNLGNGRGQVFWKGRLLPTVGRVCMDMTTVDVTGLDVHPGDRVTLWGANPRLDDVAAQAKTISYELLTRIGPRVQRVIER